jgi:hypothetical protein
MRRRCSRPRTTILLVRLHERLHLRWRGRRAGTIRMPGGRCLWRAHAGPLVEGWRPSRLAFRDDDAQAGRAARAGRPVASGPGRLAPDPVGCRAGHAHTSTVASRLSRRLQGPVGRSEATCRRRTCGGYEPGFKSRAAALVTVSPSCSGGCLTPPTETRSDRHPSGLTTTTGPVPDTGVNSSW